MEVITWFDVAIRLAVEEMDLERVAVKRVPVMCRKISQISNFPKRLPENGQEGK